jgi:uncharacterized protein YukE
MSNDLVKRLRHLSRSYSIATSSWPPYEDALKDVDAEIERLREALENISDNALTIEDAVRIADAALATMGPRDA